jgi:cysteinyl-tRNA synthetase
MAKSLGNFVTIKDFLAKYRDPDLLKLFFLSAHYSHPIDYNDEKIEEARQALERIMILVQKIDRKSPSGEARSLSKDFKDIEDIKNKFIAAMDDDFNTPQGLACIFELVNLANKNIESLDFIFCVKDALMDLLGILGISLKGAGAIAQISDVEIDEMIAEREAARKSKDFLLSDKIRKELEKKGVILEDTKEGTVWRKKL